MNASQRRRTLSFKDGLQEIKRSWGLSSGPDAEKSAAEGAADARDSSAAPRGDARRGNGRRPSSGEHKRPRADAAAKPGGPRKDAQDRPHGRPQNGQPKRGGADGQPSAQAREGRDSRDGRPGEGRRGGGKPGQQRPHRPAQPPLESLSDAERARIERARQAQAAWNLFAKLYPAFRERLPLKIGVVDDLCEKHPDLGKPLIVAVLKRHVNHPRYHERVAAGGPRYELDGSVSAGKGIEPGHIGRATAALARQKARAEERGRGPASAVPPAAEPDAGPAGTHAREAAHAEATQAASEATQAAPEEAHGEQPEPSSVDLAPGSDAA